MSKPEKVYTPEELQQYADMEAICQMKSMVVGEPITQRHIDACRHFFGKILDSLKEFSVSVEFNKDGTITKNDPHGIIGEVRMYDDEEET